MKPLLKKDIGGFLKRFDGFIDSELRSIEIVSPTTLKMTLAAQDSARAFDWITVTFEFSGVTDAKLVDGHKLSHVDLNEGITILGDEKEYFFAIGAYDKISNITDSLCYIKADSLKYKEGSF